MDELGHGAGNLGGVIQRYIIEGGQYVRSAQADVLEQAAIIGGR